MTDTGFPNEPFDTTAKVDQFRTATMTVCAGTSLPMFPRANQLAVHLDSGPSGEDQLKYYDPTPSSTKWTTLLPDLSLVGGGSLDVTTRFAQTFGRIGFTDGSNHVIGTACDCTIVAAYLTSNVATSASDESNNLQVSLKFGATIVGTINTDDAEISVAAPNTMTVATPYAASEGQAVAMQIDETGTPSDLTSAEFTVTVIYTTSVPVP